MWEKQSISIACHTEEISHWAQRIEKAPSSPWSWWEFCHWLSGDGFTPTLSKGNALLLKHTVAATPEKQQPAAPQQMLTQSKTCSQLSDWVFGMALYLLLFYLLQPYVGMAESSGRESSNEHEMEITGSQNSQDIEQWQDKMTGSKC